MKYNIYIILFLTFGGCYSIDDSTHDSGANTIDQVVWTPIDTIDVSGINSDLNTSDLTVDIGIYYPSNFDPTFDKVSLKDIMDGFMFAKSLFAKQSVQLKLLWVKSGVLNPKYFTIRANEIPSNPGTEYVNFYKHRQRQPSVLTDHAREALGSIIEPNDSNANTVYLVALQDVYFPFFERVEGERNWIIKSVRTKALSFPPYIYGAAIPKAYRGVISLTNLAEDPSKSYDENQKTIAHELGHKLMNVSHEYKNVNPEHEVFEEGGLMLYGAGLDIPSGEEGRWHAERLLLSPFLYRMDENGGKDYNPDYQDGGHYYDPIYGNKVIEF